MAKSNKLTRISDFPLHWAQEYPENEALILGATTINYAQLKSQIEICAQALLSRGIQKGDRVATLCTTRPEAMVIFLATARIGAIWVGLNPKYTLSELRYVVNDCQPKALFAIADFKGRNYISLIKTLDTECDFIETVAILGVDNADFMSFHDFLECASERRQEDVAFAAQQVSEKDPALIVYTSGTTGKPKGALLPHIGLVKCGITQLQQFPAQPLRILNNLPINHIGCVGDIFCYALVAGGCTIFMESFSPVETTKVIKKNKITVWGQVPTMFQLTLEHPDFTASDLSSLQIIFWSGAMASSDLIEKLRRICPNIGSNYGMTETVGSIVYSDDNSSTEELANTIGRPLTVFDVRICNEDGDPVEPGDTGEIMVKGDFLMCGYYNAPEKTQKSYTPNGWFKTGDLAVEEPNGLYRLIGRSTEMYKSGGYNVYPREVELAIESHPDVIMAAVVSVPDPLYQEVGHAFVQLAPGKLLSKNDILLDCKQQLASYKIPKVISILEALPILPIGKIDKGKLKIEALRKRPVQDIPS